MTENQAIGLSRGGRTTKIHAVVDDLGNPIGFPLTGGQVHDSQVACRLLSSIDICQSNIIADKAYGTTEIRQYIKAKQGTYTYHLEKISNISGPVIVTFIVNVI